MNAYSVIAKFYDTANTDFDYEKYFEFTKHHLSGRVVELACGSGAFTNYLLGVADSVVAVDSSAEMLGIAQSKYVKYRQYVRFVQDDILSFEPPSKVDAVIAVCDGFNYLSGAEVGAACRKIAGYLKQGRYFIFDISSEHKLKNLLGNNVFYEDTDDYTYLWTNEVVGDKLRMNITVFEPQGELYRREDEQHVQYIHTERNICEALAAAGFEIEVFDGENFGNASDSSMRLLFVCKRV